MHKLYNFIIKKFFKLYTYLKLGRNTHMVYGAFSIGNAKNIIIGKSLQINKGVYIQGRSKVVIGDDVTLSMNVLILDSGLDVHDVITGVRTKNHISAPVIIHDGVWIGAGAIILGGVTIGKNSVIGAGSIVNKNVPECCVVAGNPAKIIK